MMLLHEMCFPIKFSFFPVFHKIGTLQSSLPFPIELGSCLASELQSLDGRVPWTSLTPYTHGSSSVPFAQSVVLRGIAKDKLHV